jgi:hypothetical protein
MTAPQTITRNADLGDLVEILRGQHARKFDVVVPATKVTAFGGDLVLSGTGVELTADGVTSTDGIYRPTAICDGGIADKLGIPPGYLTRMRTERPDLYDTNVNGWLHGVDQVLAEGGALRYKPAEPDQRRFLVRCFRNEDGGHGVARAFLSDSFKPIENLDVLMTVLEGLKNAGLPVQIAAADLTDRRMYVRVYSDQIQAVAPQLLGNYRSPFTGQTGADNPVVFAGFEVSNSEVGHGAFSIAPRAIIQVCTNGMTWRSHAIRAQHLGGKLPEGTIQWSDETQAKNLELIKAKTIDAVRAFLDADWLQSQLDDLTERAGVEVRKPEETVKHVAAKLRYTEAQQDDILSMFIKGGDVTAGGIMQAVTASAQNQADADLAADMEADAIRALDLAVAHAGRA